MTRVIGKHPVGLWIDCWATILTFQKICKWNVLWLRLLVRRIIFLLRSARSSKRPKVNGNFCFNLVRIKTLTWCGVIAAWSVSISAAKTWNGKTSIQPVLPFLQRNSIRFLSFPLSFCFVSFHFSQFWKPNRKEMKTKTVLFDLSFQCAAPYPCGIVVRRW